jgi:hypothetical protein
MPIQPLTDDELDAMDYACDFINLRRSYRALRGELERLQRAHGEIRRELAKYEGQRPWSEVADQLAEQLSAMPIDLRARFVAKLNTGALADYGMLCEEALDRRLEDEHRYHESGGRETIDMPTHGKMTFADGITAMLGERIGAAAQDALQPVGVVTVGTLEPGGEVMVDLNVEPLGHSLSKRRMGDDEIRIGNLSDLNAPQPAPRPSTRAPAWDLVVRYAWSHFDGWPHLDAVTVDMRERDLMGRAKYGVPLASDNGRDHLVDAYQECLDLAVYLANELDRRGAFSGTTWRPYDLKNRDFPIVNLFHDAVTKVFVLRGEIAARGGGKP